MKSIKIMKTIILAFYLFSNTVFSQDIVNICPAKNVLHNYIDIVNSSTTLDDIFPYVSERFSLDYQRKKDSIDNRNMKDFNAFIYKTLTGIKVIETGVRVFVDCDENDGFITGFNDKDTRITYYLKIKSKNNKYVVDKIEFIHPY